MEVGLQKGEEGKWKECFCLHRTHMQMEVWECGEAWLAQGMGKEWGSMVGTGNERQGIGSGCCGIKYLRFWCIVWEVRFCFIPCGF